MFNFLFETFRLGIRNLRLHKLRSLLTALGIIIGVAAFIGMVAIGEGTKQAALEQMNQLGARNVLVRSVRPPESNEAAARAQRTLIYGLKRSDLARLQTLSGLGIAVPLRDTEQKVVAGDVRAQANAIGTTHRIFDVVNLRLARGQMFTELQYDRGESVCVIGDRVASQLFPYEDPMGKHVRVGTSGRGTVVLEVIGVLEPIGLRPGSEGASMMQRNLDEDLYFPLSLARQAFGDTNIRNTSGSQERKQIEVSEIWLQANEGQDVEELTRRAKNLVGIQQRGGIADLASVQRADVEIKAPIEILRKAEEVNRLFNFVMGGIAAFALLVGGIGIMNIMLASVTERTREIGIRRALGAKRRHITLQFLVETTVISVTGGLIGIILGGGGALGLPPTVEYFSEGKTYQTAIATWSVIASFVFSGIIGVCFGLYPAIKAALMNPIDALRHE